MLLEEYRPACKLHLPAHRVEKPKFPVLDVHGHFGDLYCPIYAKGAWEPADLDLAVARFRAHGVERMVNLDGFWDGFCGLSLERIFAAFAPWADFFVHFVSVDTNRALREGFDDGVRAHLHKAKRLGARGVKLFKHVSVMREAAPGVYVPGRGILIDDERLNVIWDTAAELDMPVLVHIADPEAFFDPVDEKNERYLELKAHPDWSYHGSGTYGFAELMRAQENLLAAHPDTTFIVAHVGSHAENLTFVAACLEKYPNMHIDIAARIDELGRQPYGARAFFLRWADRILFGTDANTDTAAWLHPTYYRVLETFDECIRGGSWPLYGLGLPDEVLEKVYRGNFQRIFGL